MNRHEMGRPKIETDVSNWNLGSDCCRHDRECGAPIANSSFAMACKIGAIRCG